MEQLGSANLAIFAQQLLPNPKYLHRPRFPHSKVKGGKQLRVIIFWHLSGKNSGEISHGYRRKGGRADGQDEGD
jgi:hypothetical protein